MTTPTADQLESLADSGFKLPEDPDSVLWFFETSGSPPVVSFKWMEMSSLHDYLYDFEYMGISFGKYPHYRSRSLRS